MRLNTQLSKRFPDSQTGAPPVHKLPPLKRSIRQSKQIQLRANKYKYNWEQTNTNTIESKQIQIQLEMWTQIQLKENLSEATAFQGLKSSTRSVTLTIIQIDLILRRIAFLFPVCFLREIPAAVSTVNESWLPNPVFLLQQCHMNIYEEHPERYTMDPQSSATTALMLLIKRWQMGCCVRIWSQEI